MTTNPNNTPSVDDGIRSVLHSGKEKTLETLGKWEDCVRKHPVESLLGAVAFGLLAHRLPLRSLVVTKVKLLTALAPPAMLAYGAAKLCEKLQSQGSRRDRDSFVSGNPREY